MRKLQIWGGWAAIGEAVCYIVGIVVMLTLLVPAGYGRLDGDLSENVRFLVENEAFLAAWNLIIYVLFGVLLVVLALALYDRMKKGSPALMQVATALALIWSVLVIASGMVANIGAELVSTLYEGNADQALSAWLARQFVIDGLGGGNEIVGGLWVLLVSLAGLRSSILPRFLHILGLIVGGAGVLTVIPVLGDLGIIFGLGQIIWFIWLGIALLTSAGDKE